jgi:hypothetical protein
MACQRGNAASCSEGSIRRSLGAARRKELRARLPEPRVFLNFIRPARAASELLPWLEQV